MRFKPNSLKFIALFLGISMSSALADAPNMGIPTLPAKGVPGFGVLGGLGLLPTSVPTVAYAGWITPQQVPVFAEQNRLTIQVPILRDERNTVSLSTGGSWLHFGGAQTLSGSGIPVPLDLWKVEIGGSYLRKLEGGKILGGRLSFGSASDHPFDSFGVTTIAAGAFYSWATSENSRWMLTLFFSNNNPILNYIPIPGVIYLYQTKTFVGLFGFPFTSIVWTPEELWMFTLSLFGPTINSEIAYGDPMKIQIFTGFSWLQQSYLRKYRPDANDRLYFKEMHIPARNPVPHHHRSKERTLGRIRL